MVQTKSVVGSSSSKCQALTEDDNSILADPDCSHGLILKVWLLMLLTEDLSEKHNRKTVQNYISFAQQDSYDIYKEEVKDLKEMQNVENSFSGSNEQLRDLRLKQNLFEQVQEKDFS
ncbi:hypothetical protein Tco_0671651 [Tanacetum coccineum]